MVALSIFQVSGDDHCVHDLLQRWRGGELEACEVSCVISNHKHDNKNVNSSNYKMDDAGGFGNGGALRSVVESYGIPFIFIPSPKRQSSPHITSVDSGRSTSSVGSELQRDDVVPPQRIAYEDLILDAVTGTDFLVLARYMQVLSPHFLLQYGGADIINIHHGLLPSFRGAKPYKQAYESGVKMIGATAHFVTEELDKGPIIEQRSCRVDHR